MPTIKFTDTTGQVPEIFYPTPAKKTIPEWLIKLKPYDHDKNTNKPIRTAKRCLPLLDAVMLGYTIYTTADLYITPTEFDPLFEWSGGLGIRFHEAEQTSTHSRTEHQTPKYMNPWAIETPHGYSTLFTSPLNNDKLPLIVFSGVVDTDTYTAPVHFPFIVADKKFSGLVPAGTPIAQVFPFLREKWDMQIELGMTRKIDQVNQTISSKFKDAYRHFFRVPKSFN